jgi:hypothetical protein
MPNPFVYLTDLLRGCVMTGVDRPDRLVGDFYFAYITFGNSLQCDPKLPQRKRRDRAIFRAKLRQATWVQFPTTKGGLTESPEGP